SLFISTTSLESRNDINALRPISPTACAPRPAVRPRLPIVDSRWRPVGSLAPGCRVPGSPFPTLQLVRPYLDVPRYRLDPVPAQEPQPRFGPPLDAPAFEQVVGHPESLPGLSVALASPFCWAIPDLLISIIGLSSLDADRSEGTGRQQKRRKG